MAPESASVDPPFERRRHETSNLAALVAALVLVELAAVPAPPAAS
jgi:hypothetical protein